MTNKDQLIQEMASDMNYATVKHDLWPDDAKEIARVLVLLGYCKIPEGSVVYTKEDQEDMKISIRHEIYCECNKARKEMAEKIFNAFRQLCDKFFNGNLKTCEFMAEFYELTKHFGIEIKREM